MRHAVFGFANEQMFQGMVGLIIAFQEVDEFAASRLTR